MNLDATVSTDLAHVLLNYASEIGLDAEAISLSLGIQPQALENPEQRIPAGQFQALWLAVVENSGDSDFGLHLCEQSCKQVSGDILTTVMLNCPTVGHAMQKLVQYHALATDLIQVQIQEQGDTVYYGWEPATAAYPRERQISEAVICRITSTLLALSNGSIPLLEIRFEHPQPNDTSEHHRIFPCPVLFGQLYDAILIQRKGLELPIPLAKPGLLQRLEQIAADMLTEIASPATWSERVSQGIAQMLMRGEKPDIGTMAANLAISTRQLQNKLKNEETTYQQLLNQVREHLTLCYLDNPDLNLFDIAFLLGYSDQSAFNHAFKRWTGTTPGEYRGAN
jgi:AraC-like DNA-binding protein